MTHGCIAQDCPDCIGQGVLDEEFANVCERCDGSGALTPWEVCPLGDEGANCPTVDHCAENGCNKASEVDTRSGVAITLDSAASGGDDRGGAT